jgi:hypothetical protein
LAVSLHAFDELAVVTALPVIAKDLGGRALYGSVFFAYVLASIVGLVAAGWLATKFGPGRPLGWGLTVFAVGLGIAAVAPTMEIVVAARALQGLGGGALNTIVLVIVSRAFEPDERPHVMAWTSSAWVIPSLIAPAVAGSLAEAVGWRWVFIGLLPLVGVAAALALPATRSLRGSTPERPFRTDISNGVRLAAGVGLLLTAFSREFSASNAIFAVCGSWMAVPALGRVVPGGFWLASSIIPAAVFAKFLLGFAFFGTEGFVPLAMTEIHGTSAAYAGLSLTAAALSWTAGAFVQARLAARCTSRMLAASGAALVAAAIVLMLPLLDAHTHPAIAFVAWSLAGFGMGIAYNTITTKAMAHTAAGEEGPLSTSLGVADAVGISLGTGMVGALVSFGDRAGWATADSLGLSWGATAAVALLACGIALRLGSGVVGKVQAGESAPAPQPAS